jgi:hypothetical protein
MSGLRAISKLVDVPGVKSTGDRRHRIEGNVCNVIKRGIDHVIFALSSAEIETPETYELNAIRLRIPLE